MKKLAPLTLTFLLFLLGSHSFARAELKSLPRSGELPPLEELEGIVLKRAGLDPAQIKSWQRGVKYSAALPRIQAGWESKFLNQNTTIIQDSISVTSSGVNVGPESNRVDADFGNNQDFEVKAVWALDELLFNRNQLSISREARDLFFVRSKLIAELHENYFELKSLLLAGELQASQRQNPMWALEVERKIERLNSLTGGEFKEFLARP
jgi:hypothetical protein